MRLVRVSKYYPQPLQHFYAQRPPSPYLTQHQALMQQCVAGSDFYTVAFARLGYETLEIVANAEPLQKQWAKEHNLVFTEANWMFEIAIAQIKAFAPDVLTIMGGSSIFKEPDMKQIRAECPSIRLALVMTGAPSPDLSTFRVYDRMISNIPELVAYYQNQGITCFHLHHAFEPRVLEQIDTTRQPAHDFTFAGSIMKVDRYHLQREQLLAALVRRTNLEIWSHIRKLPPQQRLSQRLRQIAYDTVHTALRRGIPERSLSSIPLTRQVMRWPARPSFDAYVDFRIMDRSRPPVFGLDMYQLLHDSKITLNTHIDASSNSASNMRLFEATGVGTCLLTDWKDNLPELFEPDREVVTYRSAEECIEKAQYLLSHERERQAIAEAGQQRTLRDHTVQKRVETLHNWITTQIGFEI